MPNILFIPKKYDWFDCTTNFECACGEFVQLDAEDEPSVWDGCGKKYKLVAYIEYQEKDA